MIDITNAAEYSEVVSKINLWYGSDAQKVIDIANQYQLTPEQLTSDWLSGSGFEPWYTSSHGIAGYNSVGTSGINYATGMQEAVNSNAGSVTQVALKTPVETTINQAGKVQVSSGLTSVATGAKSALTFVSKEVVPAVAAASLGVKLGKWISKTAYDHGFNYLSWAGVDMESLNPETWNNITSDYPDGVLKKAFNTVFGLNPTTGETQMYLDEDAAVYLAQYLNEIGYFSTGEGDSTARIDDTTGLDATTAALQPFPCAGSLIFTGNLSSGTRANPGNIATVTGDGTFRYFRTHYGTNTSAQCYICSDKPFTGTYSYHSASRDYTYNLSVSSSTAQGKTVYYAVCGNHAVDYSYNVSAIEAGSTSLETRTVAFIVTYGTITEPQSPIDGVTDQTGATTPDFSNCRTPADYLSALQNQFPDMFNNAVTQSVANPDGTTSTKKFLPVGTVSQNNNGNKEQPIADTNTSGNTQNNTSANPTTLDLTGLENLIKTLTDSLTPTGTPTNPTNPDPTGSGDTPTVTAPTGSASALWSVYNPSQAELNSFGAWLWSSNFIDQVLKLFNNPMQSIIGVHKIFATPATSGAGTITVGYLSSGVSANLVSAQYTTINCGTVKLSEYFGNVFDYTDTHVRLYLPFIGIVDLDTSDVMRGSINVVYHVDVITGACLAEVKVTRDGSGGTLYQYAGDAAVRYPISSGSYMGVVAGIASAVGGVASAVMTGGATLPLAAGAVAGGISGAQTQVQHSGNFSGNAGAMGAKKPYLIIERPQTMIADDFGGYQGKGANTRRTVAQMSGYFKFSDVHTDSISGAAESEIEAIRAALESGVIK